MKSLNEILSMNARAAIEGAEAQAKRDGQRFNMHRLAEAMSALMEDAERPGSKTGRRGLTPDAIRKHLTRCLEDPKRHAWRMDYVEAFCKVMSLPVEQLLHVNWEKELPQANMRWLLGQAATKLTTGQTRALVKNISGDLETPGAFDLMSEISRLVRRAPSKGDAIASVTAALNKSKIWDSHKSGKQEESG